MVIDEWSKLLVKREAAGILNDYQELHEAIIFEGAQNPVVYSREFERDFSCSFNLDLYPFDTQICEMWISAPSGQGLGKSIVLEPGVLTVAPAENISLAQFQVTSVTIGQRNVTDVIVSIQFKRSIMYHFVTTYVPTTCLIIIAECTLFVDGSRHFETVTMVVLTSKLVLFTLYQTISGLCINFFYIQRVMVVSFQELCQRLPDSN